MKLSSGNLHTSAMEILTTEAQMYVKPHVARYLRIIEEIRFYQETGMWPMAASEPKQIGGMKAEIVAIDEIAVMGDQLVKMLEEQTR